MRELMLADVKGILGTTRNALYMRGPISDPVVVPFPDPARLVIYEDGNGYFVIGYTAAGEFCGDTWYASIEDCIRHCKNAYDVNTDDWRKSKE